MRFRRFSNKLFIVLVSISALPFLLLGISSNAGAGSLFTDVVERIELRAVDPNIVLRQRIVSVDCGSMSAVDPPENLVFDFFDDIAFQATVDAAESDWDDSQVWHGRFDQDHSGSVTLVRLGDSVSIIAIVGERRYDVRPLENGLHVIQEITLPRLRAAAGDENLSQKTLPKEGKAPHAALETAESGMNDPAWQVFTLSNQERAKYSLLPFQADSRLVTVAQTHSQAQADANHMHHTSNTAGLYADQDYMASGWAENVAYGSAGSSFAAPEGVLLGWVKSPPFRAGYKTSWQGLVPLPTSLF